MWLSIVLFLLFMAHTFCPEFLEIYIFFIQSKLLKHTKNWILLFTSFNSHFPMAGEGGMS